MKNYFLTENTVGNNNRALSVVIFDNNEWGSFDLLEYRLPLVFYGHVAEKLGQRSLISGLNPINLAQNKSSQRQAEAILQSFFC